MPLMAVILQDQNAVMPHIHDLTSQSPVDHLHLNATADDIGVMFPAGHYGLKIAEDPL